MKKLFLLMLPLVALTFNACEKGDDNGGDNGNGSTKLVKQLTMDDVTYYFEYDNQQRTTKVTIVYRSGSSVADITYSGNTITMVKRDGEYEQECVYTLNSDGYVVKYEEYEDGELDDAEEYTYTNGIWTKTTGDAWFGDTTLTWQNGNIVQVTWIDVDDGYSDSHTYTYNDKEDKMNIVVSDINDDIWDYDFPFFISQFKGMASKNLMSKKDYSRSNEARVFTFDYTFDKDGYPTEIVCKLNGEHDDTIEVYYY